MRDFNILVLTLHSNYDKEDKLADFLSELSFKLGYYDKANTIKCLTYTQSNNVPDEDEHTEDYNACFVLRDWTQRINPEKLMDAFNDYYWNLDEQGHYDEDDNYIVDKSLEDVQAEFMDNLIKKILASNIY